MTDDPGSCLVCSDCSYEVEDVRDMFPIITNSLDIVTTPFYVSGRGLEL